MNRREETVVGKAGWLQVGAMWRNEPEHGGTALNIRAYGDSGMTDFKKRKKKKEKSKSYYTQKAIM